MRLRRWAVWSNGAQRFDKKTYFFYWRAQQRKRYIARSQAYNLGLGRNAEIPGYVKMDLVVTRY